MNKQLELDASLFGSAMSSSFVTPLRYPGGKGRLGAWLAEVIRHNDLQEGCYVEPYAGGAGAAMYLLLKEHVSSIVINDADPAIYAFWWAVLNDSERLVSLIRETPVTMDTWYQQRAIVDVPGEVDTTILGFATFFMNRTNRSGIISGGVIGGKGQGGTYKLDARYNIEGLCKRIKDIAARREDISLYDVDAMELIQPGFLETPESSLIYLDPPYYNKANQLYRNFYKPEDHAEIAEKVVALETPWLVTYDNCEEIKALYQGAECEEFSLHYSTHLKRPKAKEVLFYGNLFLENKPTLRR
ncbi:DNA adenine methylase [Kushneria sp. AK178]